MTRSNCVRWPQFEERGMQLLGVVNQPPPHFVCVCVCVMTLLSCHAIEVYAY